MLSTAESSTWLWCTGGGGGGGFQPTDSECSFQLPSIRNSSIYWPLAENPLLLPTHLPTHTQIRRPPGPRVRKNMSAGETMRVVSLESVESHLGRGDAGAGWGKTQKQKAHSFPMKQNHSPLLHKWPSWMQRITNTRDGWLFFSSGILRLANSSSKSAWRAFSLMPMLEHVRSVSGVEKWEAALDNRDVWVWEVNPTLLESVNKAVVILFVF